MFDQPMAHRRGPLGAVSHHDLDRLIADRFKKARLPVVLQPKRIKCIDQLFSSRVRDRTDLINQQRTECPQGFDNSFSVRERSTVTNNDPHDRSSVWPQIHCGQSRRKRTMRELEGVDWVESERSQEEPKRRISVMSEKRKLCLSAGILMFAVATFAMAGSPRPSV